MATGITPPTMFLAMLLATAEVADQEADTRAARVRMERWSNATKMDARER
jgi:hypothetical protein